MVKPMRLNFTFILTWRVLFILLSQPNQPKAHTRYEVAAESDQR